MKNDFNDNRFINVLTKMGNALYLNILFILCSLPVFTLGASLCGYYYGMVKVVRRDRSYAAREFFAEFKRSFAKATVFTLLMLIAIVLLWFDREYFAYSGRQFAFVAVAVLDVIVIITAFFIVWIFPVVSRFTGSYKELIKFTFVISFKHILITVILLLGLLACIYLCLRFPVSFTLIIPAGWCYASTIFIEPVFKKYIKEPGENEDGWYYDSDEENGKDKK